MKNLKNENVQKMERANVKTLYTTLAKCTQEQREYSYIPVSYTKQRELCNSLWDSEK